MIVKKPKGRLMVSWVLQFFSACQCVGGDPTFLLGGFTGAVVK